MDTTTLTILGLNAGAGFGAAKFLLDKLLGPPIDALSEGMSASLIAWKERRLDNARRVLQEASKMVSESGDAPRTVPGRILWPILEKSSLEDDDTLRSTWARLLATAATNSPSSDVWPSFPHILSELTVNEVRILDWVQSGGGQDPVEHRYGHVIELGPYYVANCIEPSQQRVMHEDNLVRLQLFSRVEPFLTREAVARAMDGPFEVELAKAVRLDAFRGLPAYRFTALGRALADACVPPERRW